MVASAACGNPANPPPDGGPPLALDALDASQIGLHYGRSTQLRVRYHADDPSAAPVAGGIVRFSIFGDPAGSTLARDQATTDVNGIATVTLTAGQAEASFRVQAMAVNAPEADFDISVSKFDFVELDAQLSWAQAVTLRALLYDDKSCAELPAAPTLPAPARALSRTNAATATLAFVNLLSKPYALVGRAESNAGTLVGYGCVDIGAELVPPGSISTVPLPLSSAIASPVASYALVSTLRPATALTQPVLTPWQTFGHCVYGAAQMLLDAMGVETGASHPHRDPVDAMGCRPQSMTSLDEQLQKLLATPPMAPASALPGVADDLASITASLALSSTLTVTATGGSRFAAAHALASASFTLMTASKSYDLVQLGLPVIAANNVPVDDDGTTLTIGAHGFTLGWTTLWRQAFTDLSLLTRFPSLGSPPIPALVASVVQPAARNGKMGCAAVDDLVCSVTTGSSSCTLSTPCASALGPLSSTLSAPFAASSGIDLTLTGTAMPLDGDGDLVVDQLAGGAWTGSALAPMSTFMGMKQ